MINEDDFVHAVRSALNPEPGAKSGAGQALVNNVKAAPDGWKICLNKFQELVQANNAYPEVQFFCIQQITDHVRLRYDTWSIADRALLCQTLMLFIRDKLPTQPNINSFIRNKFAEMMTVIFTHDYPATWPSFFSDFIGLLTHKSIIDIFIRILHAIDSEVVVLDGKRPPNIVARYLNIKDTMRATHDMTMIIDTILNVLSAYSSGSSADPKLTNLALATLREFIGWIDITLVANERCISLLYAFITAPSNAAPYMREARHCMQEIVDKKMDKDRKVALIVQFRVVEMIASVDVQNDSERAYDLAALLLSVGQQLLLSIPPASPVTSLPLPLSQQCQTEIERVMQVAYRYFEQCSASVLGEVELIDLLKLYVRTMNHITEPNDNHRAHVRRIFAAIAEAMQYPDDFNFEQPDDSEADFLEYRSQLHNLFCNLVPSMPDFCVELTVSHCASVLAQWRSQPFPRVEAALRLLFDLGEALKGGMSTRMNVDPLRSLIGSVLSSDISSHPHHQISLIYFNIVFRYLKFMDSHPALLGPVLMSFLDARGLQHSHPKVRGRSSYLLFKVLSTLSEGLKKQVRPFLDTMLQPLQQVIVTVLFGVAPTGPSALVAVEDAQYLCEVLGILVSSHVTGDACAHYVTLVLSFFHTHLTSALHAAPSFMGSPDREEQAGQRLALMLDAFGNLSKALGKDSLRVRSLFDAVFLASCQVFLLMPRHEQVRSSLIFVIHRMIECQGDLVIAQSRVVLGPLISESNERNILLLLPLFSQFALAFKQRFAPAFDPHFVPLCHKVSQCLDVYAHTRVLSTASSESVAYSTDRQERILLEQRFFGFLKVLLTDCPDVFLSPLNASHAWPVIDSIVKGVSSTDTNVAKTCLYCLQLLLKHMQTTQLLSQPKAREWVRNELIVESIRSIVSPTFDVDDAQRLAVLRETLQLHRSILSFGLVPSEPEFATLLVEGRQDAVSARFASTFLAALQSSDLKALREAIKVQREALFGPPITSFPSGAVDTSHLPFRSQLAAAARTDSNTSFSANGAAPSRSSSPGLRIK